MNWINLLYLKPELQILWGPKWFRQIHMKVLTLAYYLTHTLALAGLSLVFLLVVIPLKIWFVLIREDLLDEKVEPQEKSYLKPSNDLATMDFKRMF